MEERGSVHLSLAYCFLAFFFLVEFRVCLRFRRIILVAVTFVMLSLSPIYGLPCFGRGGFGAGQGVCMLETVGVGGCILNYTYLEALILPIFVLPIPSCET